jgi:endonuclease G
MRLFGSRFGRLGPAFTSIALLMWLAAPPNGKADAADDCAEHLPYGAPLTSSERAQAELHLCAKGASGTEGFFALGYDRARGIALWTAYRLTRTRLRRGVEAMARRTSRPRFRRDRLLEARGGPRLSHADFTGSGYDRGHLVPAAAMRWRAEAYLATFRVSNLALQNPDLNRGPWRRLEVKARAWACAFGSLYVITGTLDGPPRAGEAGQRTFRVNGGTHRVSVPTAFYKLLFSEAGAGEAMAVIHENPDPGQPVPRARLLSVDALETLSGLDFFPDMAVERQDRIEAAAPDLEFWENRLSAGEDCSSRRASAALPQGDRAAAP